MAVWRNGGTDLFLPPLPLPLDWCQPQENKITTDDLEIGFWNHLGNFSSPPCIKPHSHWLAHSLIPMLDSTHFYANETWIKMILAFCGSGKVWSPNVLQSQDFLGLKISQFCKDTMVKDANIRLYFKNFILFL